MLPVKHEKIPMYVLLCILCSCIKSLLVIWQVRNFCRTDKLAIWEQEVEA